jgi:hypothetical protein
MLPRDSRDSAVAGSPGRGSDAGEGRSDGGRSGGTTARPPAESYEREREESVVLDEHGLEMEGVLSASMLYSRSPAGKSSGAWRWITGTK